ncbi:MAG TPA: alpha/beta hydrolase [Woeseiaceae bacterium]|nr:alpha/beta hydrolase [Woeseiaceae bacterium]
MSDAGQFRSSAATRLLRVLVVLPFLLLPATQAVPSPIRADRPPAPGMHVWVGDHRLHLDCKGAGSPTVVFDAGLGGSSLDWTLVQPEVATFTRACAYDRAGYAWSDPGPMPRDAKSIVRDLEQLLGNGSVAAPYVLVGHSLGGLIVQHFARQNPHRIAGLVLVDATHEDQFRRLRETVVPARGLRTRRWSLITTTDSYQVPDGLPEEIRRLAGAFVVRPQSIVVVRSELSFLRRTSAPLASSARLPDVPLVVISHRLVSPAADTREGQFEQTWMELQQELAAMTRRSEHVIAGTEDHHIHIAEPQTVIDAVRGVVEQSRATTTSPVRARLTGDNR